MDSSRLIVGNIYDFSANKAKMVCAKVREKISGSKKTESPKVVNNVDSTKQKGELTVDKKLTTKDSASLGNGVLKVSK